MKPIKLVARINWLEWADVRETDLTREQVGNGDRDRADRGINSVVVKNCDDGYDGRGISSIIVMTMRWSG